MRKSILFTVFLAMMLPLNIVAQDNLLKAIDKFVNDESLAEYIKTSTTSENSDGKDRPTSFYYSYKFEIPMYKANGFFSIVSAFNKDQDKAYRIESKDAFTNENKIATIYYGENLKEAKSYGGFYNRNYRLMYIRDKADSQKRYFYAIVWYTDKKKNNLCGIIDKVYSKDPQKAKKQRNTYDLSSARTYIDDEGNLHIENGSTSNVIDAKYLDKIKDVVNLDFSSLKSLKKSVKDLGVTIKDDEYNDDCDTDDSKKDNKRSYRITANNSDFITLNRNYNDSITTSMEFMQRFGNLRAAYKSSIMASKSRPDYVLITGVVNKILELCRTYGHVAEGNDKQICINSLKEFQKETDDSYIAALFGESIKALNDKK